MTPINSRPPCGTCDPATRLVELPDGRVARCRRCHPLRHEFPPPHCRYHPDQDAEACSPCLAAAHQPRCDHGVPPGVDCLACARYAHILDIHATRKAIR